jgi:outer membrane protein OmpA-like peptidoglycan-associated protein
MRGLLRRFGALALLCLLASGCASKSYVVLVDSPDGSTGGLVVNTAAGTTVVDRKNQGVALDGRAAKAEPIEPQRIARDFTPALKAQPALPISYSLYFKSGGAELTPESEEAVRELLRTVRERGPSAVSVIGHTDTVSGERWNEKLGLMRAQAIARMLKDAGLQAIELVVTSHGERNLLVPTPDDTPEPKNRRVEVVIR